MARQIDKIMSAECSEVTPEVIFEVVPKVIHESVIVNLFDIDPYLNLESHLEIDLDLDQLEEPEE